MASNVKYVDFECEENAIMPYKKYSGDAGWDLFVSEDCDIPAGETVDVHTGLKFTCQERSSRGSLEDPQAFASINCL